jgi:hypothetical protein
VPASSRKENEALLRANLYNTKRRISDRKTAEARQAFEESNYFR